MHRLLGIGLAFLWVVAIPALAAEPGALVNPLVEEAPIPKLPSKPPEFKPVTSPKDAVRCQRKFVYQGRALNCDSHTETDGEGLRSVMSSVPAAVAELDRYQKNRQHAQITGYTGTLGLLFMLAGPTVAAGNEGTRNITIGTGLLIAAGSLTYGLITLQKNESHLDRAVEIFNQSNPDRPIELQFSTGINF